MRYFLLYYDRGARMLYRFTPSKSRWPVEVHHKGKWLETGSYSSVGALELHDGVELTEEEAFLEML